MWRDPQTTITPSSGCVFFDLNVACETPECAVCKTSGPVFQTPTTGREVSHVHVANRLLDLNIDTNGCANLSEKAIERVDRMVATLMRIRDGAIREFTPHEVVEMAKGALQR